MHGLISDMHIIINHNKNKFILFSFKIYGHRKPCVKEIILTELPI